MCSAERAIEYIIMGFCDVHNLAEFFSKYQNFKFIKCSIEQNFFFKHTKILVIEF